ncbi:hypothetical protein D9611_014747 [Ephemerocybe angulata]|uniref:F-box domain-containing protein n=1 Tax=Ephemerocybe angulata TaxID=980116 RepID=A0A8H5B986_9AGAR|nr:hypothetical protein D9611_014747 [Tulosesus angulatus]
MPTVLSYSHYPHLALTRPLSTVESQPEAATDDNTPQLAGATKGEWRLGNLAIEVLGEIMSQALPSRWMDHKDRKQLAQFCLVSRQWRDAAHQTHSLWGHNIIRLPFKPRSHTQASRWISRALNSPSGLHIVTSQACKCTQNLIRPNCHWRKPSLIMLLESGPRIAHLSLATWNPMCFHHLLRFLQGPLSFWRPPKTMGFEVGQWNPRESFNPYIPNSLESLSLTLPSIATCGTDIKATQLHLQGCLLWQLTNLVITCDWGGGQIAGVLLSCANLECLEIRFAHNGLQYPPDFWESVASVAPQAPSLQPTIILSKLRTLRLCNITPYAISSTGALECLKAPSLVALHIHLKVMGVPEHSVWGMVRCLTTNRHGPSHLLPAKLLSLGFSNIKFPSARDLVDILSTIPSLKHLILQQCFYDAYIFSVTQMSLRVLFLPHLEHLELLYVTEEFRRQLEYVFRYLKERRPHHYHIYPQDIAEIEFDGPPDSFRKLTLSYRANDALTESVYSSSPTLTELRRYFALDIDRSFCL